MKKRKIRKLKNNSCSIDLGVTLLVGDMMLFVFMLIDAIKTKCSVFTGLEFAFLAVITVELCVASIISFKKTSQPVFLVGTLTSIVATIVVTILFIGMF